MKTRLKIGLIKAKNYREEVLSGVLAFVFTLLLLTLVNGTSKCSILPDDVKIHAYSTEK